VTRLEIVDRALDADLRCFVEDDVGIGDRVTERIGVTDFGVDEQRVLGNMVSGTGREIVVDGNGAVVDKSVGEVAADESRTARNERVIELEY